MVESLIKFAQARGYTILELAFAWLLAHKVAASVIGGASKPSQIRANAAAANWQLSADDLAALRAILRES